MLGLVVTLVDDATWRRCGLGVREVSGRVAPVKGALAVFWALVVGWMGIYQVAGVFRLPLQPATWERILMEPVQVCRAVNSYGLFAVMTQTRDEIILQGSRDGLVWENYVFRWKPGPLDRPPPWVVPGHMPRLDWQMWFAALGEWRRNPWLVELMRRLLEGAEAPVGLLQVNPFAGQSPPLYVRAVVYRYRFTTREERDESGAWWKAEYRGIYLPPVSREDFRPQR